jgi:hypothetical protein
MFERMPIDQLLSLQPIVVTEALFAQPIDFVRLTLGHYWVEN